jgi:hypothetical protein
VTNKLSRRNHESAEAARRALVAHGYQQAHVPPDAPDKWAKKGSPDLAIGREDRPRSSVWHIVEYPE